MQVLELPITSVNLPLLGEQIAAGFPELDPGPPIFSAPYDYPVARWFLEKTIAGVRITLPDSFTRLRDLNDLVSAHNPLELSRNQIASARRDIDRASARGKLRASGLTDAEMDTVLRR